jgi:hypothetical protein
MVLGAKGVGGAYPVAVVATMAVVVVMVLVIVIAASQPSKPIFGDARRVIGEFIVPLWGRHCYRVMRF